MPRVVACISLQRLATKALLLTVLQVLALGASRVDAGEVPRFGEVVEVRLVTVELLATDAQGRPVTDLTAAELRVFEQDAAVAIDSLEWLTAAPPAAGERAPGGAGSPEVAPPEVAPPLHLAVFLDEVHLGAASRRRLLADLADVLGRELRPEDRVMVARYDGATRVALPFTTDRRALARSLGALEGVSTTRLMADQDRSGTLESISRDAGGAGGAADGCLYAEVYVNNYSEREYERVTRAVGAFGRFVDSLAGIAGRKVVLHVSDGIPMRAGAEVAEYAYEMCGGTGAAQGQPGAMDARAVDQGILDRYNPTYHTFDADRYDTAGRWEQVTARANAGNVSVYTFQAGIPDGTGGGTPAQHMARTTTVETQAAESGNLQDSLFLLADRTGGRLFRGGGDPGEAVAAAVSELRHYYLLTYVPPAGGAAEVRHVRVETTRPGVTLRYRKLYTPRTAHEQVADQLLGRLLYGSDDPPGSLVLELRDHQPEARSRVRARFQLLVPIALLTLPEHDAVRQGMFTVFLAVADARGDTSPVRQSVMPVRVPAAASPQPEAFVWEVEMVLGAGEQNLAVAVRDEISGETSFLVRRFTL